MGFTSPIPVGVLALIGVFGLAACDRNAGPKQSLGGLSGVVIGGLAGSQVGKGRGQLVATGLGAVIGGLAGSEIGKSLDRADQLYASQLTQQTLENTTSGTTTSWHNPDSGNSGTITPQPAYRDARGGYCREFQQTIQVGGETETAYGTACRQPDGAWKIVG